MTVPESTLTEVKPAGGFTAIRPRNIPVLLFCSSKGSTTVAQAFNARAAQSIVSNYGCGGARKAAYVAQQINGPCVCLRLPATQRSASKTAATVSRNNLSDFTYTLSGTPTNGADVVIKFGTVGGNTGTGPIAYYVSLDGGATYGSVQALGTATTIVILGVTVALGSGKVVTANDQILWFQRAASQAVLPQTVTGTGTATYVVSGTPNDAYRFRLEWITGGTLGSAGASYRYCLDWDGTTGSWSQVQQLGTGLTIQPLDGVEASGLTITLSTSGSSTVVAGDVFEFATTAPEAQWSDVSAAMTTVRGANLVWSWFVALTPLSATDAGSADTLVTGWATGTRRTWVLCETRDREATETISAWQARQLTDFQSFTSTRVFACAGHAPAADPTTGQRFRRSSILDYASRLAAVPQISTDPGQVTLGALPASRTLYDATTQVQTEYDADVSSSLFDRGFLVLRTFEDDQFPGTYPAGGVCMPDAGNLSLVALRRVLDAFEDALQSQARLELLSKPPRWTAAQVANSGGKYKAGDIRESAARAIENRLRAAAKRAVVDTGDSSGIESLTLNRTPVPLSGGKFALSYQGQLAGLAYIYGISGTAGLVDPSFQ